MSTVAPQQQAILASAIELLANGGPQALRVRDIAEHAGCTTMAVYSKFGGKNGLAEAIYIDGFTRFRAALQIELDSDGPDQPERLGMAYRLWALDNPGSYQVMFTQALPGFAPSDRALAVSAQAFDVLLQTIETAQRNHRIADGDTLEIAWAMWGVAHGLVMLEVAGMTPPLMGHDADQAYTTALAAIAKGFAPD